MTANEAPERIYLEAVYPDNGVLPNGLNYTPSPTDIEYTNTNAFIEKALAYLNSKFYFHNAFYAVVSTDFNAMEEMCEDFRKYMEGEGV